MRRWTIRTGLLVLSALLVACGSSTDAPRVVTGVWAGRNAYMTPNDSFTFYFKQDGTAVQGWGFVRPVGVFGRALYGGTGTLSGGQLDLSLQDLNQLAGTGVSAQLFLRGTLDHGRLDAMFGGTSYNANGPYTISYPIAMRLAPPIASELLGTWALTSSTGAAAVPGSVSHDTIVVNASGGAWRHRDGFYSWDPLIATRAIWVRTGGWLVIEHESPALLRDSLLIQSGELQRTTVNYYGARIDHYTRLSAATEMP